jgi:hypothetical protein
MENGEGRLTARNRGYTMPCFIGYCNCTTEAGKSITPSLWLSTCTMPSPFILLFLAVSVFQLALAHGSLKAIEVAGKRYLAWQINQDQFQNPLPVRYARRVLNEGPVKDFTGKGITYDSISPRCLCFNVPQLTFTGVEMLGMSLHLH